MSLRTYLTDKVEIVILPEATDDLVELQRMASASWLHGVLRLFDVMSGRLLFRKLVDKDIQFLTISSRIGLSVYRQQQIHHPEVDPRYPWGILLLAAGLNEIERNHCSLGIAADYANAKLAERAALGQFL